ncbi:hypothetical protein FNF27_07501 [Cafeteria roenbergensis]|uniref:Uncharacterized protein n=1 Tax=Cafeteria roenbergensis TaxID=33653 RepID=A0A5A8DJ87_CAFRO|nr:hypothetical protein FNF31_01930 [Cafeteria roenbergensis]KAA0165412.1 hypothetical protein FNF28_03468 [Cafeteria roenbergensis]KAA0166429.1 hypothetical protein FNF27_07501 [Cafeteria roenbergensis]
MAVDGRQRTIASMFVANVPALPTPQESKAPPRATTRARATESSGAPASKRPRPGKGSVAAPAAVEVVQGHAASSAAVDLAHPGAGSGTDSFSSNLVRALPEGLVERVPAEDHGLG